MLIDDTARNPEAWVEVTRFEVLERIERFMTEDLAAIEIVYDADPTAVGTVETFTWILVTDGDEQIPIFLMMKDPVNAKAVGRWFVHGSLLTDSEG